MDAMRKATIFTLAAAMLPALSHAQTVNICDRTPIVRDEFMRFAGANDCAAVDSATVAGITQIWLPDDGLTALALGDFAGQTILQGLSWAITD